MGTNGTIARINEDGSSWEGREVNYDAYPTGVGLTLFEAYHDVFGGDAGAMAKRLVDDEKVGWSSIAGTNLALRSDWTHGSKPQAEQPPQSYHVRGEDPVPTTKPGDYFGSWLYVIWPNALQVVNNYGVDRFVEWSLPRDEAKAIFAAIEEEDRSPLDKRSLVCYGVTHEHTPVLRGRRLHPRRDPPHPHQGHRLHRRRR